MGVFSFSFDSQQLARWTLLLSLMAIRMVCCPQVGFTVTHTNEAATDYDPACARITGTLTRSMPWMVFGVRIVFLRNSELVFHKVLEFLVDFSMELDAIRMHMLLSQVEVALVFNDVIMTCCGIIVEVASVLTFHADDVTGNDFLVSPINSATAFVTAALFICHAATFFNSIHQWFGAAKFQDEVRSAPDMDCAWAVNFWSPHNFSRNRFQMLHHQLHTWACHVASNDRRQAIFMTSLPHWISLSSCSSPSFDSWHGSFSHDLQMLSCTPDGHVEVDSHHLWHPVSWSSWLMSSSFGNSPGWHCMCLRRSLVFWSNLSESTSAVPLRIASPKGEKPFWLIRSFWGAWVNGVPSACVKCCWLHKRSLDSISFASVTLCHSVLGPVLLAAGSTGGFKCLRLPACFGLVIHQIMACAQSCCLACLMFFKHFKCTLLSVIFAPSICSKRNFFTAHVLSGRVLCNFAWQFIVGCTHSLCCHLETHCQGHPIHHVCNQVIQKGQAQFWDCSDVVVRTCESGWHFWSLVTTELFHAWPLLHQGEECQQWMLH